MAAVQRAHRPRNRIDNRSAATAERFYKEGRAHGDAARWGEAARCYRGAVTALPAHALSWLRLAEALRHVAHYDESIDAATRALAIDPTLAPGYFIVIACRLEQHRYVDLANWLGLPEVQSRLDHAGWAEFGFALFKTGQHHPAIQALFRALSMKMDYTPAYVTLGNVFDHLKMPGAAIESFRTAAVLKPNDAQVLGGLVHHSQYACRWESLAEDIESLHQAIAHGAEPANPFALVTMPSTAAQQLSGARGFIARRFGGRRAFAPVAPRAKGERLSIGYLSCDYYSHATASLVAELFELHDRSRFEITLYSYSPPETSPIRQRLEASGDRFVDVNTLTDEDVARRIRDDGIDILVDLKGHTRDSRSGILAYRPAPVQLNYLGFPGTMGADFVDWIVTDPIVTPLEHAEHFAEKFAYLPACYQPNDRQRRIAGIPGREACGLPDDAVVLCCFNHSYKITPGMFDRWARVMHAVPDSVLWLLSSNVESTASLVREAAKRGIEQGRLVFAPPVGNAENLARLSNADLFLDTSPVNAHTTASDALWAGVPVLTFPGETFVSRVAASIVSAAGLGDALVTASADDYERRAIELASDRPMLASLRRRLVDTRLEVPLFDSVRYTRDLEALYARMVDAARDGVIDHLMPASVLPA